MITPKESPPAEVLERIADDYRRRGYDVFVQPRGRALPPFLADATPDLIARRGDEHLVIEVKHSPKDVDPAQMNAIAQRVAQEPGWRFVLLATNPEERHGEQRELTTVDEPSIRRKLQEANTLLASGHLEAALMLAWAATEAVLRLLVARHGLPITRPDALTLIRQLVSDGYITDDAFEQLNDARSLRSAVAHGARVLEKEGAVEAEDVTRSLFKLSNALLRDLATV